MAEAEKTIKLKKLGELSLREYLGELAAPERKPRAASAAAVTGGLAASIGALSLALAGEAEAESLKDVAEELRQLREYMLIEAEEVTRSHTPLTRRLKEERATADEIESAARVACGIPNELVYIMCRLLEMLDKIADVCRDEDVPELIAAAHMSLAVIASMRAEIRALSKYMSDETFRYTVNREAELNVQEHQALTDALLNKLHARLEAN